MQKKVEIIGYIRNKIKEQQLGGFSDLVTEIVFDKKYEKALKGLEDYSHVIVIYWMNEAEGTVRLEHRPQGNPNVPILGIFATRCQWRPNCIGISTVPLISVDKNIVKVKGLDAIDKTPILDIKPYLPDYDKNKGKVKLPEWTKKLVYK